MARKINRSFTVELRKSSVKGGAWMLCLSLTDEDQIEIIQEECSAWANASAAKRYIKEKVKEWTPRKSVPLLGTIEDEKGKPTLFSGSIRFKVDA